MKKSDILLIFIIIVAVASVYVVANYIISDGDGARVAVYLDKEIIDILPLYEDVEKTYKSDYGDNTVSISGAKASVVHSNCRNKICVDSPSISKVGETIVCLPHHFYVEIIGDKEEDIDAIAK